MLADNPVGQWNRFFIRMVGEKVWVWLNGKLVVDAFARELLGVEQADLPGGQIELQNHSSHLWFKNVYIKELPRPGMGSHCGHGERSLRLVNVDARPGDRLVPDAVLYARDGPDRLRGAGRIGARPGRGGRAAR